MIGVGDFSNNEVQENEGGEDDHDDPSDPEQDVLLLVQTTIVLIIFLENTEVEVTERQSKSCEEVSHVLTNMSVFIGLVGCNDIKDHGEHDNEDDEEEHEDLQITDNHCDHGYDVGELLHNSHEEERFDKAQDNDDDQDNFGFDIPGSNIDLAHDVSIAHGNMQHVNVVPRVSEVGSSLFDHLGAVVSNWVHKANEKDVHVGDRAFGIHSAATGIRLSF